MKIEINHTCEDFESYRAARVKSLFNVDDGSRFDLVAELPIEDRDWSIGLVVGPSGSGKTSIGGRIFGNDRLYAGDGWPADKPIIDAIAPDGDFDAVTAALSSVGLGSVPAWLRPYHVLSNGEQFRADLARIVCDRPAEIVIDEFSSVVDRQIAKIGAMAFGKAWRRTGGRAVLLSCHYDIAEWLQPDWVYDTGTGQFTGRYLRRRPGIDLEFYQTDSSFWSQFECHHYLKLPKMIAADYFVAFVENKPIAHLAYAPRPGLKEARAARFVVLPEWQGIGIGRRFLNAICARWRRGMNRYQVPMPTLLNTSHPGLARSLRADPLWVQVSTSLYGTNKIRSRDSIIRNESRRLPKVKNAAAGYGGHFRAVQGFRYVEGAP